MAVNENLKNILNRMKSLKKTVQTDLSGWDPRTLASAQTQKSLAESQLTEAKEFYKKELVNCLFRVFVTGPRSEEFEQLATKEGALVVDGSYVYSYLAGKVLPSLDRKDPRFGPNQLALLIAFLVEYGQSNGWQSFAIPEVAHNEINTPVPDLKSLVEKIRKSLRVGNGDEMTRLFLEREIITKAIELNVTTSVVPVFIVNLSIEEFNELKKSLFPRSNYSLVETSADSNPDNLWKAVNKEIKSKLKSNQ